MGNHEDVRSALDDHGLFGLCALSHPRHRGRRNVLVSVAINKPGRDFLPGRRASRLLQRGFGDRALSRCHELGFNKRNVCGELIGKLVLVDVQIMTPIRQGDRRGEGRAQGTAGELSGESMAVSPASGANAATKTRALTFS